MTRARMIAFYSVVLVFASSPVHAYLDPGTGSMVLQALLGLFAAAAATCGIFWQRIKAFLERLTGSAARGGNEPEEQ